jgi:type VI secretion system protein VasD
VRVRLYELRNATTFSRADYFSLVDKAQATLAADLVAQDELLVKPSDRQMQERTLDEGTRQFGIVVGYRELDAAVWRDVITVPLNQTSAYSLKFGARGVTVAPAPITEH